MDEHDDVELQGLQAQGQVPDVAESIGVPGLCGVQVDDVEPDVVEPARLRHGR